MRLSCAVLQYLTALHARQVAQHRSVVLNMGSGGRTVPIEKTKARVSTCPYSHMRIKDRVIAEPLLANYMKDRIAVLLSMLGSTAVPDANWVAPIPALPTVSLPPSPSSRMFCNIDALQFIRDGDVVLVRWCVR